MLNPIILQEFADHLDKRIVSADVQIDGVTYPARIRRSFLEGATVRKHIYLTKGPYGTVTRARLLGASGEMIAQRTDPQQHSAEKGLLLEFKFVIQEV
ncbi:hemolysin [Paenibacillus dendritiformis]|uniref:hemolysin n=1 Tax=Paenibacillus dendritiformis TaxID=130049 RepID=UPI000DA946B0|nr:hemolysin [Paenibacillus dendritiformis]PZM63602.1 hemolysin [Paenibacillus dendritiformis]